MSESFNLEETLERLAIRAKDYEAAVNPEILEAEIPSYIVQVGPYTLALDIEGKLQLRNATYPTQFTKERADMFAQKHSWKDGAGKRVIPKVMTRREWYQTRLNEIRETLEMFGRSNA